MGKMRFKLSHVMPHVWFYKLKEIGKTGDRTSHSHCISSPHKQLASTPPSAAKSGSLARIYTSPVNHKAMDISFPETPKKSPLNYAEKEDDEAGVDLHDSVDFANFELGFSSSNTLQAFSSVEGPEMEESQNDDHLPGDTSAARYSGVSFDVRELERRLKALGQEERRKYYNSPMFSVALPSPILDGVSSEILDLPDSRFAQILRENEGGIRKSLHEDQTKFFHEGGRSSIASTSFRQSTSSSDTGFERASSSLWEKDVFSLTSEGSDPFTTIDHDIDSSLLHRFSRQIKKQKDKKRHLSRWVKAAENPLLQGNSIVFNRQSDNTDVMCTVETIKTSSPSVPEPQPGIPIDSINFWHTQSEQPLQNLLDFEECDLSLLQYDSDDHRSSSHRRGLSQEFSYSQTKDRLLSGRFSLDQCSDSALSESELENATKNYTRFKLQKRSSSSRSNPSPSPDPGLYKVSCKKSIEPEVLAMLKGHDNNSNYSRSSSRRSSTDNRSSYSYRKQFIEPESFSIQKGHEDCCSLSKSSSRRSSTDSRYSYQNMGSNIVAERNNIEGHSWYKGTLRVVKENTREPSFQAFSSKAQSKVLDSFAMVKCSYDPHQDFKESMVEMILEKELQSSNELVELLQCYLTLNSEKYHDTIIKVFGEVWSDLFHRV